MCSIPVCKFRKSIHEALRRFYWRNRWFDSRASAGCVVAVVNISVLHCSLAVAAFHLAEPARWQGGFQVPPMKSLLGAGSVFLKVSLSSSFPPPLCFGAGYENTGLGRHVSR